MNTHELIEALRAQADFIDADTYDECWEVKETPRGKMLRAAASRIEEMDAEIKRLREIESFAQTAARWSNPERRHPHTIVSADEMLKAIWGHPSRAALEHQP